VEEMPTSERTYAEQMNLFAPAQRAPLPRWEALPVEVRREVVRLLVRLLNDRVARRTESTAGACDE
jgi:hypothetical protein